MAAEMKLYLCTSDAADRRYCTVTRHGSPLSAALAQGRPIAPILEELQEDTVRLEIDEHEGGLELPDLLGNERNYLVVRRACADALLPRFSAGPHESAPVTLINRKRRVHADDYVVLNPLGKVDCLDAGRSEMSGDTRHPVVRIFGEFRLRSAAVPEDRDIFRVQGLLLGYVFSERVVEYIRQQRFTNFVFEPVQLS